MTGERADPVLGVLFAFVLAATPISAQEFVLSAPDRSATVLLPAGETEPLRLAVADLVSDVRRITGREIRVVDRADRCAADCMVVGALTSPTSRALVERLEPGAAGALGGKWEAYRVRTVDPRGALGPARRAMVVAGSDERGAMFGIYAFLEEQLGVDPLYFWTGREPAKRPRLAWDRVSMDGAEPTFRYRGWFLNDEDLLVEWKEGGGTRHIEYAYYGQVTAPEVHDRVFESLLRLRMNLVIPASFNDVANPDEARAIEMASRRGLFVSMHHVEPMGVSGFAFQNYFRDRGRSTEYSITKRPEAFEEVWRFYARLWARYPNVIWQLGLRGIADRPVWVADPGVPSDDAGRGKLISDAVAKQWEIVKSVDRRPSPPATTTLWMEGARLHEEGHLDFPAGVAVIFSDNTPGWQWQDDFRDVSRQPGLDYGIYYHHALWGEGPRFAQAVSPARAHRLFGEAVAKGSTHYAILNVGNVREFVLGLDASARMLRDFRSFDPDRFLERWTAERFGAGAAHAAAAYRRLFDSYVTRPGVTVREKVQPEYPVLLDGQTIQRGRRIWSRLLSRVAVPSARPEPEDTMELRALLADARRQAAGLEEAARLADRAAAQGAGRELLDANLRAQTGIMLGLTRWLEAGVAATLAEQRADRAEVRRQAEAGAAAMRHLRASQTMASRGRFTDWYRGDRKMNVKTAEAVTNEVARAVQP